MTPPFAEFSLVKENRELFAIAIFFDIVKLDNH